MTVQTLEPAVFSWTTRRDEKRRRMQLVRPWMKGPVLQSERLVAALETLIVSGDRIVLEGDNQKQADFLSRSLVKVDPGKVHDLHLIISSISRPEHLTLFEFGIAKKVDFAFAGPQSLRVVAAIGGWQAGNRRHPHLRRTVCAAAGGFDSECGSRLRRTGRCGRQPLYRAKHGRHTRNC